MSQTKQTRPRSTSAYKDSRGERSASCSRQDRPRQVHVGVRPVSESCKSLNLLPLLQLRTQPDSSNNAVTQRTKIIFDYTPGPDSVSRVLRKRSVRLDQTKDKSCKNSQPPPQKSCQSQEKNACQGNIQSEPVPEYRNCTRCQSKFLCSEKTPCSSTQTGCGPANEYSSSCRKTGVLIAGQAAQSWKEIYTHSACKSQLPSTPIKSDGLCKADTKWNVGKKATQPCAQAPVCTSKPKSHIGVSIYSPGLEEEKGECCSKRYWDAQSKQQVSSCKPVSKSVLSPYQGPSPMIHVYKAELETCPENVDSDKDYESVRVAEVKHRDQSLKIKSGLEKRASQRSNADKQQTLKSGWSPSERLQASPASEQQASPASEQLASPASEQQASPASEQLASPTSEQQASPTSEQQASPTSKQQASPTSEQHVSPTSKRPASERQANSANERRASQDNQDAERQQQRKLPLQQQTQPVTQPETKTKSQPETKTQSQPGTKTQSQPETKTQSQTGTKTQSQPETKTQSQPETKTQSQPGTKTQSQPETKTQSQPETKTQSQPEALSQGAIEQRRHNCAKMVAPQSTINPPKCNCSCWRLKEASNLYSGQSESVSVASFKHQRQQHDQRKESRVNKQASVAWNKNTHICSSVSAPKFVNIKWIRNGDLMEQLVNGMPSGTKVLSRSCGLYDDSCDAEQKTVQKTKDEKIHEIQNTEDNTEDNGNPKITKTKSCC